MLSTSSPIVVIFMNFFMRFLGSLCLVVGLIFHYFFKDYRFTITNRILTERKTYNIPNTIYMTNKTKKCTLDIYISIWITLLLNPQYTFIFMDDDDCKQFINKHFDKEISQIFQTINNGAMKSDLWRYMIIYKNGGIYMDADATCFLPFDSYIRQQDTFIANQLKQNYYSQWFFGSKKNNPILKDVLDDCIENLKRKRDGSVFHLTGPLIFNKSIINYNIVIRTFALRYGCAVGHGIFVHKKLQYLDKDVDHWSEEKLYK